MKKLMFLMGCIGVLAQVLLMRECLVVFAGNELTIGTSMSGWLVGVSIGAAIARLLLKHMKSRRALLWTAVTALLVSGVALPFQLLAIRNLHSLLGVTAGEMIPFQGVVAGSFLSCSTMAAAIGFIFPLACALARAHGSSSTAAVGTVYTFESMGSLLGGGIATFILLPLTGSVYTMLIVVDLIFWAMVMAVPTRRAKLVFGIVAVAVAVSFSGFGQRIKAYYSEVRWRSLSVVGEQIGGTGTTLIADRDSAYQNLGLTKSGDQWNLYANGHFTMAFPDPYSDEHFTHFVMAQNPSAKHILLVGGNPVGIVPELLKYPDALVIYVEPDKGISEVIQFAMPDEWAAMLSPRLSVKHADATDMLHAAQKYDVIILNTPDPTTAAASRFYAREFLTSARDSLKTGGFLCTTVSSAERLQSEAVELGGSIYQTFEAVFHIVLVTAGDPNTIFAGGEDSPLTFDRGVLHARSSGAKLKTQYFRPEYFLGADEIDPDKVAHVTAKYSEADVTLNTYSKPTPCLYNMMLWSRYSGSRIETFLGVLARLRLHHLFILIAASGVVGTAASLFARSRKICMRRPTLALAVAVTGFTGMTLNISLMMLYQGVFGSIYSRIGLMVSLFMLGLVVGSRAIRALPEARHKKAVLAWQAGLAILAAGISLVSWSAGSINRTVLLIILCSLLTSTGLFVGAQFPVINGLLSRKKDDIGRNAALTDLLDHLGAAVGAAVTGAVLLPVLGVTSTCAAVALLNAVAFLALALSVDRQHHA